MGRKLWTFVARDSEMPNEKQANVAISIKPKYVERILDGMKRIEFRCKAVRLPKGTRLWIYSTHPASEIGASAVVESIEAGTPEEIWVKHQHAGGITKKEFDEYFNGREIAYAIELKEVKKINSPISLQEIRKFSNRFHPPQFFSNIDKHPVLLEALEDVA